MDLYVIAEQAAAGLLVASLSRLIHWLHTRRSRAPRTTSAIRSDLTMEHRLMGRSGHINSPDLPHGPHRQLLDLMRQLLAKSGLSGRAAAKAAGMPNSTFQKALSRPEFPTLNTSMAIILALAAAIDDREEYLDDIGQRAKRLWVQADRAAAGPDPIEVAARELWTDIMRGSGYIPDLHYEVRWALDRAIDWSLTCEHGGVTVGIWLPD